MSYLAKQSDIPQREELEWKSTIAFLKVVIKPNKGRGQRDGKNFIISILKYGFKVFVNCLFVLKRV